ncbi:hypothetical protein [Amycolatopsis sp. cmx-11-12]|uniref:hypothetical protein n=1 Tax=Amycolatopsis sp. cmx-11-12 TaxID=2785795 RepID=UPI003918528D
MKSTRLILDVHLRAVVQAKLELDCSPEQIANYLRTAFPDRPRRHVCHETIYHGGKGGLSRTLTKKLRTVGRCADDVGGRSSQAAGTSRPPC